MLKGLVQLHCTGLLVGDVTPERLKAASETGKPGELLICASDPKISNVTAGDLAARLARLDHPLDWTAVFAQRPGLERSMGLLEAIRARLSKSSNVLIFTDAETPPLLDGFQPVSKTELAPDNFLHRLRRPFPKTAMVFSYWQNPGKSTKRAEYLDLCTETVLRNLDPSLQHIELNENTIHDYLPGVRADVARLPTIAHRADYYRALLVHRHGGYWLDRDCILTTSMLQCQRDLEASHSDFIAAGRPGPRPSIGFFGGLADCSLLRRYIKGMDTTLDASQGKPLGWTALGYNILWPLTVTYDFFQYEFTQAALVAPGTPNRFFEKGEAASFKEMQQLARCVLVFLYNAQFPAWFKAMSAKEIMASDMLMAHLFRKALRR